MGELKVKPNVRAVRFRVYGKENKIMYSWDELLNMDSFNVHMRFAAAEDRYYSPLMQFTGLKDKNGKDIYEGDIICQEFHDQRPIEHGGFIGVVRMLEGCWVIDNQVNHAEQLWSEINENEVLGNMFENPELLVSKHE